MCNCIEDTKYNYVALIHSYMHIMHPIFMTDTLCLCVNVPEEAKGEEE